MLHAQLLYHYTHNILYKCVRILVLWHVTVHSILTCTCTMYLQCSHHAEVMEAIHNLAVTMGKKMDAMMSTLSDIKKKQDHLALELKQVCPPTPVTAEPRQLSVCFPTCSTPAMDPSWYKSDSFTNHTPKAGAKPAFKVSTTTCSEAA